MNITTRTTEDVKKMLDRYTYFSQSERKTKINLFRNFKKVPQ